MLYISRRLSPLFLLFVLLASCGTIGNTGKNSITITHPKTTDGATTQPASSNTTTCPEHLSQLGNCLTPQTMRMAYGLDPLINQGFTGKGQTIIDVVSFGSPTLKHDMEVYDKTFGLPPIDLQVISPLNVPESDPRHDKVGWAQETELDVQIIHSLAPEARVVVLTSPVAETEGTMGLPEFFQLEQYIVDHKLGNVVSQSWGVSELTLQDAQGQQEIQKWNTFLEQATTKQNITYFSSSGDNGATDYADMTQTKMGTVPTTSFAPDSPWVTSVGGTTIKHQDSIFHETAWSGSGGGFSSFFQMPSYQKTLPAETQNQFNNRRGIPDVSAAADPFTGLAIYLNGQWTLAGGTSASAPVWASIAAIANQKAGHPLGFINPGLYKLASSNTYSQDFHDITEGNNTNHSTNVQGYNAVPGWDPVTGLGTPNSEHLVPDLIAALQ